MNWCVSLAGTCPLPGPSQFFSSMFVGDRKWFFFPHIHPCPEVPPSPLPLQEAREGVGGQGSPSVLRLHRVFRLNQENFYYQKEKKEKKKFASGHLPSLPHWDSQDWIWGFLGGWLRAGTLSGKSGGVPWQALRQAHFGLLPSPDFFPLQATHQRWPSPAPRPLGYRPLLGPGGVLHSLGEGERWDPGSLHTISSALLPQSWAFPSMSCCGDICSPPQKSVPSSPTFLAEGRADPSTGRGEGVGPWALSLQGAAWEQGHRLLRSGRLCLKAQPLTTTTPHCSPFLGINLGTVLISQPCLFFLALPPLLSGDCPGPPWLPGGRLDWAAGPGASVLHRVGQSDSRLLTSKASV